MIPFLCSLLYASFLVDHPCLHDHTSPRTAQWHVRLTQRIALFVLLMRRRAKARFAVQIGPEISMGCSNARKKFEDENCNCKQGSLTAAAILKPHNNPLRLPQGIQNCVGVCTRTLASVRRAKKWARLQGCHPLYSAKSGEMIQKPATVCRI